MKQITKTNPQRVLRHLFNPFLYFSMLLYCFAFASCSSDDDDDTPDTPGGGGDSVYQAVDLGLSVKWASCNVGASSPEGYGDYFAWGETDEKSDYDLDTYKYYQNGEYVDIGTNISGTKYDVARAKWGGKWRMPTRAEIEELCDECTWVWTTYNSINGIKVTGPNGNSIFLPAAGGRDGTDVDYRGYYGYYWSGSLDEGNGSAWGLGFSGDGYSGSDDRCYGLSVRPVAE